MPPRENFSRAALATTGGTGRGDSAFALEQVGKGDQSEQEKGDRDDNSDKNVHVAGFITGDGRISSVNLAEICADLANSTRWRRGVDVKSRVVPVGGTAPDGDGFPVRTIRLLLG